MKKLANPLDQALRFLSFRPRSEHEVSDYLSRKNWGQKTVTETIDKLKHLKFLDDTAFCSWWQTARDSARPRSSWMIKKELSLKGVPKDIIDAAIDSSFTTNLTRAQTLYARKQLPREKAIRLLSSRGFSWDIIKQILD